MSNPLKIVVLGHGMVGHKFLERLALENNTRLSVTVLCEEPRPAYDRVHLSEFFSGKSADDLSLVAPGFFEQGNVVLKLNARAIAVATANPFIVGVRPPPGLSHIETEHAAGATRVGAGCRGS